jgi:hypothetical protein
MTDDRYEVAVDLIARNLCAVGIEGMIRKRPSDSKLRRDVLARMQRERERLAVQSEQLAAAWTYVDGVDQS